MILNILIFILGCVLGYYLHFEKKYGRELLNNNLNTNIEEPNDEKMDLVLFKRSSLHIVEDVSYDLFDSYFVMDDDGFGFKVNEYDFEKWKVLFDGDEVLEFWFKERSTDRMYREIIDVGLVNLIIPETKGE